MYKYIFKMFHSAPMFDFCLPSLLWKPTLTCVRVQTAYTRLSQQHGHIIDGPCWPASLSTQDLDRSSLDSTGTVIVKYSLLFNVCIRPCFPPVRGTVGLKAWLFCCIRGLACMARSCHGPIDLHHKSTPKRGWRFSELFRLYSLKPCVYRWGYDLSSCLP